VSPAPSSSIPRPVLSQVSKPVWGSVDRDDVDVVDAVVVDEDVAALDPVAVDAVGELVDCVAAALDELELDLVLLG
jgi:hypothetical protein